MVFIVAFGFAFGVMWIVNQRSAQVRLIKERLASERKGPERAPEDELSLLRDEQLSEIPAIDMFLRLSSWVSKLQKMLRRRIRS